MIKIDWALGYANLPRIIVEDSLDLLPREECDFTYKDELWYHVQKNGLVRYFAHSGLDRNEGGFGGANITIRHNGEPKVLKGPWSSRASCVGERLGEAVADISLDNGRGHPIHIGILVSKLVEMWNLDAYLLREIRNDGKGEQGAVTASLDAHCILKPDDMILDRGAKFEIFAERKAD